MIKKLLKIWLVLVSLTLLYMVGTIFVEENLAKYTVYYAQRMPHAKDKHPLPFLVLEELYFLEKPKNIGYSYDLYESHIIYSDKEYLQMFSDSIKYRSVDGNRYNFSSDTHKFTGVGTENGNFTDPNEKEFRSVNVAEVWRDIDSFLEPFIKRQPKPTINLQWLFNWRYEKRFD
ncbi:hypothetical protein [Streptococcus thoraltensis]|uniref:hypothetical protein n=1 Tax=Streptococcus thoraltensis TaxID=55085 RepID=UPI0003779B98|nr:hypothetical protein [Streptococcus thoraltensis]MDY4762194.1 hypothetical protein [Streptococcus thoraltensis]